MIKPYPVILGKIQQSATRKFSYFNSEDVTQKTKHAARIFSGIQPTGIIHLGNYLGAVVPWLKLQQNVKKRDDMLISVVDLHSMTLPHKPRELHRNILEITATLLGCGIDSQKIILFQQSAVTAHTELLWYLGCISTMARLAHLPQFKEKSRLLKDVPLGLYVYPVLQAADILAYKATQVPVGEDQVQHIELTQELAKMFNSRYGETFPRPHCYMVGSEYARLRSLRDPTKKMSKSDPDAKTRISLTDKADDIVRNIKKAVTDSKSEVTYNPVERPGVSNLISIHSFVSNKSVETICQEADNMNTGQYKLLVAEAVIAYLEPIQQRISEYLSDKQYLMDVLKDGSEEASCIASQTIEEVRCKLGVSSIKSDKKRIISS